MFRRWSVPLRRGAPSVLGVLMVVASAALAVSSVFADAGATLVVERRGNPLLEAAVLAPGARRFEGRVLQILPAGSYSYCEVEREGAPPAWVATLGRPSLRPGDRAHVVAYAHSLDFESRHLGRTFDELRFGMVLPASAAGVREQERNER